MLQSKYDIRFFDFGQATTWQQRNRTHRGRCWFVSECSARWMLEVKPTCTGDNARAFDNIS